MNAAVPSVSQRGISVPASRLQEFEPTALGALRPRYRRLLAKLDGQPQSAIRRLLIQEVAEIERREGGIDQIAYRASLLILRDYVASGYYPIISAGRCYLAPIFESPALDADRRRAALARLYRAARDRALIERGQLPWIQRAAGALPASAYNPERVMAALAEGPPQIRLARAMENNRLLDTRGLWRAVRATWSMGAEASAPGREVAFVAFEERAPDTPVGILQFRNVVPEIMPRDLWLGVAVGTSRTSPAGFAGLLGQLSPSDARERIAATADVFRRLRAHVVLDGLPLKTLEAVDAASLARFARQRRERFRDLRRSSDPRAHEQLIAIKRAETLADLSRGIEASETLLASHAPDEVLRVYDDVRTDLDAGLKKLWHYHMGFVAIELSVCGAAPPFGPLRVGKLMAGLAGTDAVIDAWGTDRPLGQIASKVYREEVRAAVPNPGPVVVFTSGLFPGHSAQYNRAASGSHTWRKIGETSGFGSFHVSVDTLKALSVFNEAIDGYAHITRTFGEGSGPRFRAVGRALARLGVPDLRRHEVKRPLYALPLVEDPPAVLLGWSDAPKTARGPTVEEVARDWWTRWVHGRFSDLSQQAAVSRDLVDELEEIAQLNG
jgi:hypothetical protein